MARRIKNAFSVLCLRHSSLLTNGRTSVVTRSAACVHAAHVPALLPLPPDEQSRTAPVRPSSASLLRPQPPRRLLRPQEQGRTRPRPHVPEDGARLAGTANLPSLSPNAGCSPSHCHAQIGAYPIKLPIVARGSSSLNNITNNQLFFLDWDGHLCSASANRPIDVVGTSQPISVDCTAKYSTLKSRNQISNYHCKPPDRRPSSPSPRGHPIHSLALLSTPSQQLSTSNSTTNRPLPIHQIRPRRANNGLSSTGSSRSFLRESGEWIIVERE